MTTQNLIHSLNIVREYFSHNMRTSTAMVVATVSVMKLGLDTENDDIDGIIIESSYFLDIYDKGMEVVFNHVLDKPMRNDKENVAPLKIVELLLANLTKTIEEQGSKITCNFKDDIIIPETNSYILKTLLEVIICEEIKKSDTGLTINSENNTIIIRKHMKSSSPEIYDIFADMLHKLNIEFTYNDENTTLRFL